MSNLVDNVPMADGEPEARKDGPAPDSNMDNSFPTEDELNKHFPDRPRNDKETFTFYELQTTLLEPLLANSKRKPVIGLRGKKDINPHESRRNIIDKFISRWRTEVGNDIFPAFRLVLCEKDRDRNVYHLKEQKIGKLLVEMMKINKDGEDGYALLHWRQPGTWSNNAGDFALRCFGRSR
jgi:DNA ligase-4